MERVYNKQLRSKTAKAMRLGLPFYAHLKVPRYDVKMLHIAFGDNKNISF